MGPFKGATEVLWGIYRDTLGAPENKNPPSALIRIKPSAASELNLKTDARVDEPRKGARAVRLGF